MKVSLTPGRQTLRLLEEYEQSRVLQLREFNKELGHRLTALDRGERLDVDEARALLRSKSEERRKKRA